MYIISLFNTKKILLRKRKQNSNTSHYDYEIMNLKFLNEMKLKTNETNFNLTNTGSLIIEDKNLIIISNELNPKNLTSNQTLCASIIYNQSLNSTG